MEKGEIQLIYIPFDKWQARHKAMNRANVEYLSIPVEYEAPMAGEMKEKGFTVTGKVHMVFSSSNDLLAIPLKHMPQSELQDLLANAIDHMPRHKRISGGLGRQKREKSQGEKVMIEVLHDNADSETRRQITTETNKITEELNPKTAGDISEAIMIKNRIHRELLGLMGYEVTSCHFETRYVQLEAVKWDGKYPASIGTKSHSQVAWELLMRPPIKKLEGETQLGLGL
jgi:hypothetical protein